MQRIKAWLERHSGQLLEIVVHVVAWLLYLSFAFFSYIRQSESDSYKAVYMIGILLTDLPLFYFYYQRAIPRFLVGGKKSWFFTGLTLLILMVYPLIRYLLDQVLIYFFPNDLSPFTSIVSDQFWTVLLVRTLGGLFVIVMSAIGKFTFDWFRNMSIRRELETQNLVSELAFLKSQINPHFLFNTLNNIHTLSFKKSELAPDAIMKLSELMRYMIYESDSEFVSLEKEVHHLQSFIDLQSLRFKNTEVVSMSFEGDLSRHQIAPLLLLPFVENAFKHGYRLNRGGVIKIKLQADRGICFEVENPISKEKDLLQKDIVGGVGLENITRRLELIYSDRYTLDVNQSSTHYRINLKLSYVQT